MSILTATRHPNQVTAAAALDWFAGADRRVDRPVDRPVIGYLYAPDRAEWFRYTASDDTAGDPRGRDGATDLRNVFEIAASDGTRWLRWLHETGGVGAATALAEDGHPLPQGEPVEVAAQRSRFGVVQRRLAGTVVTGGEGWARLSSARYAPYDVPVEAAPDQQVWAELVEFTAQDEHGNLAVVDTLLTGLHPRTAGSPSREAS